MSKSRFTLRGLDTVPPHANAGVNEKLMAWLKTATKREFFESLVHAGIYSPDGKLAKQYVGTTDLRPVLTAEQMGKVPPKKLVRKTGTKTAPRRTAAKTAARESTGATRRKTVKKASRR